MKTDNIMPELIMLVGLPASGKSTYVRQLLDKFPEKNYIVLSTDDILTSWGEAEGLNYTQAYHKFSFKKAQSIFNSQLKQAINDRRNIIVDKTSLTIKSRNKTLSKIPSDYKTKAIVFEVTIEELKSRIDIRAKETGKKIPEKVLAQMIDSYQPPSRSEFDELKRI